MKKPICSYYCLFLLTILFFSAFAYKANGQTGSELEYYQLKIYHLTQKSQEARIDSFLRDAYIPALHRAGISKVGVFKPVESDTAYGKRIYVFIPFQTIEQFTKLPEILAGDKQYNTAGKSYLNAVYNNPSYARIESILLKAVADYPEFLAPKYNTPVSERIYELRSYESATETYGLKKIDMFNRGGEIGIFKKLLFNPVFFAQVISGARMPGLMYMPTFQDKATQDEKWVTFRNDPDWKQLSSLAEFKNTVSRIQSFPLHPTSYSDI
jgi:hypothetical protein